MSSFLRLDTKDLAKGVTIAVIGAVLGALQQSLNGHGLDVASYDWAGILDVSWKVAVAYLSKNLLSDSEGKVLGKIG